MHTMLKHLPQPQGTYRIDYSLKNLNWFKVGGVCDAFFRPHNLEDLQHFLRQLPPEIPIFTLGAGSNLLIRDNRLPGIVIKLGQYFTHLRVTEDHKIIAGGSLLNHDLLRFCCYNQLQGLEFLAGIPGTIGGAVAMNAGIGSIEIKDVIHSITAVDYQGNVHYLQRDQLNFKYRHSGLDNMIIIEAVLNCNGGDENIIKQKIDFLKHERHTTQPTKETCGSVFLNPIPHKAWQLIDQVGLRGHQLGGAQISTLHTNFIVNLGNATAQDIEGLGEIARARVFERFGINLQWEIKRIGI